MLTPALDVIKRPPFEAVLVPSLPLYALESACVSLCEAVALPGRNLDRTTTSEFCPHLLRQESVIFKANTVWKKGD